MLTEIFLLVCAFGRVDEAVSGGKPPAGKGVDSLS